MSEISLTGLTLKGCVFCGGDMEVVRPRALAPFRRCVTCGRENRHPDAAAGSGAPSPAPQRPASPSTKCSVEGCPGFHAPGASCSCCENRADWVAEHFPKRRCEICDGAIEPDGGRKLCSACRPLKARVAVAKSKSKTKGAR